MERDICRRMLQDDAGGDWEIEEEDRQKVK